MQKKIKNIEITVLTGLHIGVGNDLVQIGGIDSTVIKDPVSGLPYIPGSSLKGKLRCLLDTEGAYPAGELNDQLNTFFGPTSEFLKHKQADKEFVQSPTRLIFRDLKLTAKDEEAFKNGTLVTESKTEIKIDRSKGIAKDGGLRTIERVPPDVQFTGQILIRFTDNAELHTITEVLNKAIELLKNDFLGGSGSRGYGAVQVKLKD